VTAHPDRAELFLARHPALLEAQTRSSVWPRVRKEASVEIQGTRLYVVGGDMLGSDAALFLDRLARGARALSSDPLSRELFLELPPDLQSLVRRELLLETGDEPSRPSGGIHDRDSDKH
jgi:hypothetical protein